MTPAEVTAHLMARGTWRYSRASGPGGQHRDHAETRAELHVPRAALEGLPAAAAERLGAGLGLARRALRLTSQAERSRERNRALVEERLAARVADALARPRPRRPTRPSLASAERRRAEKTRRGALKGTRRRPAAGED
jgi:ribosome-associated protein